MAAASAMFVAMKTELNAELEEYTKFWDKSGIDHDNGGFMCSIGHDGTRLSDEKFIWYQGRGLWVYSRLYRLHGQNPAHLAVARKAYEFLLTKFQTSTPGVFHVSTDGEGTCTREAEPVSISTSGYGGAFAAEGMFEYFRASNDVTALNNAMVAFRVFAKLVDGDERISDETHYPHRFEGVRALGHQMIFISLTRQVLEPPALVSGEDLKWMTALNERTVGIIMDKFFNPDYDLLSEALASDYSRPNDANEDFVYLGHGIETLWMVAAEAVRRKNWDLYNQAMARFKRHVEVATDQVYGGVFRGLSSVKNNIFLIDEDCKVKWAQDEVIVGCAMLIEHARGASVNETSSNTTDSDSAWGHRTLVKFRDYLKEKFSLKKHGYDYWIVGGDRQVTFKQTYVNLGQPSSGGNRKEHYHHPRMIMLLLEAIQRIEASQ
eukprot:m.87749 g.87749  ORF g.87749 m.87749 type:complete len:434 (-) comp26114_c0_seq2:104-1405(-)